METPRPSTSDAAASPGTSDERLPPASPPGTSSEEARTQLEAEMVAVLEKITKLSKLIPDNLKWDGKPDTTETGQRILASESWDNRLSCWHGYCMNLP